MCENKSHMETVTGSMTMSTLIVTRNRRTRAKNMATDKRRSRAHTVSSAHETISERQQINKELRISACGQSSAAVNISNEVNLIRTELPVYRRADV